MADELWGRPEASTLYNYQLGHLSVVERCERKVRNPRLTHPIVIALRLS